MSSVNNSSHSRKRRLSSSRASRYRNCSTSRSKSALRIGDVRRHQLGPAAVERAVIALAEARIAGPGAEPFVEALAAQAHLRVERHPAGDDAATGLRAFLPIVHVVLLEGAGRA